MKLTKRYLHRKAVFSAALFTVSIAACLFAAMLQPSLARQVNAGPGNNGQAVFTRRYDSGYASRQAFMSWDPFTRQNLASALGLEFLFIDSGSGLQAYCVQKGMYIYDTGQITRRAHSLGDPMFSGLPAAARENILLVALYGYPNRSTAELGASSVRAAQAATQILMWESQLGYRDAAFNRTDNRIYNAYFTGGNMAEVRAVYEGIERRIQEYHRVPSFLAGGNALQLELAYESASGRFVQRFTDTGGSNATLAITGSNPDGIAITREGNVYIFSAAQAPTFTGMLTIARTDIPAARTDALGPPLFWVDPGSGLFNQVLFTGVEARFRSWAACVAVPICPPATTTAPATTECITTTTACVTTTECITTTTTAPPSSSVTTTTTVPPSSSITTTTATTTTTAVCPTTTTTVPPPSTTACPTTKRPWPTIPSLPTVTCPTLPTRPTRPTTTHCPTTIVTTAATSATTITTVPPPSIITTTCPTTRRTRPSIALSTKPCSSTQTTVACGQLISTTQLSTTDLTQSETNAASGDIVQPPKTGMLPGLWVFLVGAGMSSAFGAGWLMRKRD